MILSEELWNWLDRLSLEDLFTLFLWIPFIIYKKIFNANFTYLDLRIRLAPLRENPPGAVRRVRQRVRHPHDADPEV